MAAMKREGSVAGRVQRGDANRGVLRVLIADDSAFVRIALRRILTDAGFEVVGAAHDGLEAVCLAEQLAPDVVTLDINMPHMDGREALRQMLQRRWVPVVLCSTVTRRGADITIECLSLGAVDFVTKPDTREGWQALAQELPAKLRVAASVRIGPLPRTRERDAACAPVSATRLSRARGEIVLIAASTGGPRAVEYLLSAMPGDLPVPIMVTQHMPAGFTASFARRLDRVCAMQCVEAQDGVELQPSTAYVAAGGWHLCVTPHKTVHLDDGPPRWGLRPAADVMFTSAAKVYSAGTIAVVLTGMGRDGAEGARAVKRVGGLVIAESERTAVIYGMPKAVVEMGLADSVADLEAIPQAVLDAVVSAQGKAA